MKLSQFVTTALFALSILLNQQAMAATKSSAASSAGHSGFELSPFGTFVTGTAQTADASTIVSRRMLGGSAGLELGYAFSLFEPLIIAEYQYIGQTTDPSTVSSQNAGGTGYRAGAGLKFNPGGWTLVAAYDLTGSYKLNKATASGGTSTYTLPTGIHILLGHHFGASYELGLTYSSDSYASNTADGVTTDITSNKFILATYGLFAVYHLL